MKNKKLVIILCFTFMFCQLFAESWYVCLSSFSKKSNAEKFVHQMESFGYKGCIEVTSSKGSVFYRVLVDKPFSKAKEARVFRDEMNESDFVLKVGIKGLWVCESNTENFIYESKLKKENEKTKAVTGATTPTPAATPKVDDTTPTPAATPKVDDTTPTPAATPTSVITPASVESEVFDEPVLDSVIEEKSDETEIEETAVFDFTVTEKVEKFEITDNTIYSDSVISCLQMLPEVNEYNVNEVYIFDLKNLNIEEESVDELSEIEEYLEKTNNLNAAGIAFYENEDLGNKVEIFCAHGKKNAFEEIELSGSQVRFSVADEDYDSFIYTDGENYYFTGIDKYKEHMVKMKAPGFTREEMIIFVKQIVKKSSILKYKQINESFGILPDKKEDFNLKILNYSLELADENYEDASNNEEFEKAIQNHYISTFNVVEKGKTLTMSFYDLSTEVDAINAQELYLLPFKSQNIGKNNHKSNLSTKNSWFRKASDEGGEYQELSFTRGKFAVSLSSYDDIIELEFLDFAIDLKL